MAEGGFQVEELARLSYPAGIFVDAEHFDYQKALDITKTNFYNENTILFEAAFGYENLFVRTDIVEKKGNNVRLIEVKAKSFNSTDDNIFVGKRGGLVAVWKPYLLDIAFQKYVAQKNYPYLHFTAYLMMADKSKIAQIDGLNQLFRIPRKGDPRKDIERKVTSLEEIGGTVLSEVCVDDIINAILDNQFPIIEGQTFEQTILSFQKAYAENTYLNWPVSYRSCKGCEFKTTEEELSQGKRSGFRYCFEKQLGWNATDFKKPNLFEIWNFRSGNKKFEEGKILLDDFSEDDFNIKIEAGRISTSERQWIQVEKRLREDNSVFVLKEELKAVMESWQYPLHFIDFETSAVALPFTKGRKPYEQVAFQFSHHIVYEDGRIEHHAEYINNKAGEFPNFHFARALKNSLSQDEGSVFKYATHENSIVNAIIEQLKASDESDKWELIDFLKSISHSKEDSADVWTGDRDMVDLLEIVKKYYYNPLTKGSNSIKYVLPAVINSSTYLQIKYSKSIGDIGMSSKNFVASQIWLQGEDGCFKNPYQLLPPLFSEWSEEELESIMSEMEGIADGGAALTAYAKLQYEEMTDQEREELTKGLLKYCELDTLAMVMLYEHFKYDIIKA
ncbi:DUF2779 domain-containing protein [Sphingobacterium hotanense]|uniref:DUF2779 domain-containing protein n=1 Tax=Sphingobacterium hotanense TaxID=649196 RepID=UPI002574BCAE|nr:DUF2779 domain-containing protein [Sphingobacterium hotanense]